MQRILTKDSYFNVYKIGLTTRPWKVSAFRSTSREVKESQYLFHEKTHLLRWKIVEFVAHKILMYSMKNNYTHKEQLFGAAVV